MQPRANCTVTENGTQFYEYTPSGKMILSVVNKIAAEAFHIGKECYVDFTQAE